jgi:hypothetical protein
MLAVAPAQISAPLNTATLRPMPAFPLVLLPSHLALTLKAATVKVLANAYPKTVPPPCVLLTVWATPPT